MNILWLTFIILHALSGVVCFAAGVLLLSTKRRENPRKLLRLFLISLSGLIVFLVGAIISHWHELDMTTRFIYIGLFGLSLYMMYRAIEARRKLLVSSDMNYVDDVGFPLISLFNGFIIVGLIDLHAPGWIVAAGAIAATVVGGKIIGRRKSRLSQM